MRVQQQDEPLMGVWMVLEEEFTRCVHWMQKAVATAAE